MRTCSISCAGCPAKFTCSLSSWHDCYAYIGPLAQRQPTIRPEAGPGQGQELSTSRSRTGGAHKRA